MTEKTFRSVYLGIACPMARSGLFWCYLELGIGTEVFDLCTATGLMGVYLCIQMCDEIPI